MLLLSWPGSLMFVHHEMSWRVCWMGSVPIKLWKEIERRDRNEEKRGGSMKKRGGNVQRLQHGLFSAPQISRRLLMGVLLVQVPCRTRYLLPVSLLHHFVVQGQLFLFPPFNTRCRLRPRLRLLYMFRILPPIRHLVLLPHPVHRVHRPRDHVRQQTTKLSAPNLTISPQRCLPLHAKRGWRRRKDGRDGLRAHLPLHRSLSTSMLPFCNNNDGLAAGKTSMPSEWAKKVGSA
jgi:hypothetical protein